MKMTKKLLAPEAGTREITFSRDLWIEADDFLAQPIPKYNIKIKKQGRRTLCVGYGRKKAGLYRPNRGKGYKHT